MNTVQVRNLKIGEGIPKICIPVVGITKEEIITQTQAAVLAGADIVEWRADWYKDLLDEAALVQTLNLIRSELSETPLLFTIRTAREGGEVDIFPSDYAKVCQNAFQSGKIDLTDVEIFLGKDFVTQIIKSAHDSNIKVVASNHDFHKTPSQAEIMNRLLTMQEVGADILKIAVTPQSPIDIATLLMASAQLRQRADIQPVVTISMKGQGVITRISGEIFGSAITFGTASKASAPGQIDASQLRDVLSLIHQQL